MLNVKKDVANTTCSASTCLTINGLQMYFMLTYSNICIIDFTAFNKNSEEKPVSADILQL